MHDKEIGYEVLNAAIPGAVFNEAMALRAGSRARELLTGTTARAPNNDREQCALQMAYAINPYSNWRSMPHDGKEAAYRCADLALSWHAPATMEQDVERLAEWLTQLWHNHRVANNGPLCAHLARALIARYGTPPDAALAPSPAEAKVAEGGERKVVQLGPVDQTGWLYALTSDGIVLRYDTADDPRGWMEITQPRRAGGGL